MPYRSPVILWLLLVATICVDVAVLTSLQASRDSLYEFVLFHALFLSQLSIVCIWAATTTRSNVWVRLAPLLFVILATLITTWIRRGTFEQAFVSSLAQYGLHAALLLAVLWLLQRTAFWHLQTGIVREWRYSMTHLLVVMTIIATLVAVLRRSAFFGGDPNWLNLLFTASAVALAIMGVVLFTARLPWIIRLAGVLGFAVLLSAPLWAFAVGSFNLSLAQILCAHYLVQGLVLSIWLTCAPILPGPGTLETKARGEARGEQN